jgi:hypothetical protein
VEKRETVEPKNKLKISRRPLVTLFLTVLLFVVTAGGMYVWHTLQTACEINAVQGASELLISQMRMYDDVYVSAAAAPSRGSTIYPVSVMQRILMDTQQIDVPACMRTAKSELIGYMGDAIRAFHAYEAQEDNATVKGWLDSSYAHVMQFIQELDDVEKCAPSCWQKLLRTNFSDQWKPALQIVESLK